MAEKKFGWGTVLLASSAAGLVAGGVVAYLKREELRTLAEDIISKVRPGGEDDDLFEFEDDLFEPEDDGEEEETERDIILTEDEDEEDKSDDESGDVEVEISVAREDDAEDE